MHVTITIKDRVPSHPQDSPSHHTYNACTCNHFLSSEWAMRPASIVSFDHVDATK